VHQVSLVLPGTMYHPLTGADDLPDTVYGELHRDVFVRARFGRGTIYKKIKAEIGRFCEEKESTSTAR